MKGAVGLAALAFLLAGCSGGGDEELTAEDCSDDQSFNRFEKRCVSSDFEVCRAWISGGVSDPDDGKVSCQVDSDGKAWLDWGFGLTGTAHVTVKDGAGEVVYENNVGNGQDSAKVTGVKGRWTLAVDFGSAAGTGEIYLWG